MPRILKADRNFTPCPVREGDELFPNGIFEFNVTRILEHIARNPAGMDLVEVDVSDFYPEFSVLDQSHVGSVDISRPVVLAEISPGISKKGCILSYVSGKTYGAGSKRSC